MGATERWYHINAKTRQLMLHTELDGPSFLRHGPCKTDDPVDIDQLSTYELRRALKDLVQDAK